MNRGEEKKLERRRCVMSMGRVQRLDAAMGGGERSEGTIGER